MTNQVFIKDSDINQLSMRRAVSLHRPDCEMHILGEIWTFREPLIEFNVISESFILLRFFASVALDQVAIDPFFNRRDLVCPFNSRNCQFHGRDGHDEAYRR
jgi:hypothetical protein